MPWVDVIAVCCSVIGIAMAILSYIFNRKNASEEAEHRLHEELLAEERRTEELSRKLKEIRLKYGESDETGK